jgi:3-deoxy-manno-octulosonate cytidylyltransferase (CMP-KDO synthetase)
MTRAEHSSGTDRVAEAVAGGTGEIIVNIQGDEPLIEPGLIDALVEAMADPAGAEMATAATPIRSAAELNNPSVVKVVRDQRGLALYFSRSVIPFVRDGGAAAAPDRPLHWRHIGAYAYRRAFLERLVAAPPSALEQAERLEQLRALHIGGRIRVLETEYAGVGVDTADDVARVERLIRERGMA